LKPQNGSDFARKSGILAAVRDSFKPVGLGLKLFFLRVTTDCEAMQGELLQAPAAKTVNIVNSLGRVKV